MNVELRPIDSDNTAACLSLRVTSAQSGYIAANEASLRTAAENPDVARPFAVCVDGQAVGFAMLAFDMDNEDPADRYWLWRFMIGAEHQGKGYGTAALKEIIRYFREQGAEQITLSTKPGNTAALTLYHKFGFRENGQMNGEEAVLKLRLLQTNRSGGSYE